MRIKQLPADSIKLDIISTETFIGFIEREPIEIKSKSSNGGINKKKITQNIHF